MAAISRGIDVSEAQGAQPWAQLAAGGLTFAMVKASEGEHTRDAHYRMHMDGILSVPSLLPQGYHYAWPNQDAHAEADNYLGAVQADADRHPGFVHWLDLERNKDGRNYAGMSAAGIRAYAEAWIDRVRAAFPRQRVGCYTSAADIADGHYPRNADALWYPAYPVPAITYTQAGERTQPRPGGITALFWQFADTPTDRSICYMTPAALRAWAGEEDDVQLTDTLTIPANAWSKTPQTATVGEWIGLTNQKADAAVQGVRHLTAMIGALSATVAKLAAAEGGDLTADDIKAAAKEGGLAALAEGVVHVEVTGVPPVPANAPTAAAAG